MNPRRKHGRNRSSDRIYFQKAGNLLARTNDVLKQAFALDAANELTGITRNNELTVAGGLTNTPTSLSINGQGAGLYNDKTFAASGVGLNDGMNTFTAIMVTAGGSFTNSTTKTLPASVSLTSDLNGNLIYDGQKAYQYDCANELTSVTVSNSWRNEYVYDGFGRRRVAKNYVWYGGTWQEGAEKRYLYDGNNVIQERDGNNHVLVSYTRGTDLSGDFQGAGGIGGLLARTDVNGSAFYHADGNGNITMMIDSSGDQLAKYLYDSFGNTLGMWGTVAAVNTYRFSSKEIDTRSGLYYYDARYYDPNYQRWIQRDPVAEQGGINLNQFVSNNPINYVDPNGLWQLTIGGGYWLGGKITFGNNGGNGGFFHSLVNGQWNFGAYAGVGMGFYGSLDPEDSGCHKKSVETAIEGEGEIGLGPNVTLLDHIATDNEGKNSLDLWFGLPGTPLGGSVGTEGVSVPTFGVGEGGVIGWGAQGFF